jgi:hypothetical protein
MNLLKKLIFLPLILTVIFACQSPGNAVRSKHAVICRDVSLPPGAMIRDGELITYRNRSYVLSDRYVELATHSGRLVECGRISQCVIRHLERERDCEIEQRTLLFNILGHRRKCSLPAIDC